MARNLISILDTLEQRIELLKEENEGLRKINNELEQSNSELRRSMAKAAEDREKALLDVEYLRISHKLADSPDSLVEARKVIAGLIRNIDRCIEMLKE